MPYREHGGETDVRREPGQHEIGQVFRPAPQVRQRRFGMEQRAVGWYYPAQTERGDPKSVAVGVVAGQGFTEELGARLDRDRPCWKFRVHANPSRVASHGLSGARKHHALNPCPDRGFEHRPGADPVAGH